jgi:hypothetical protein
MARAESLLSARNRQIDLWSILSDVKAERDVWHLMKEMHFSQQIITIGTSRLVNNQRQRFATEWSIQSATQAHRGLVLHLRGTPNHSCTLS